MNFATKSSDIGHIAVWIWLVEIKDGVPLFRFNLIRIFLNAKVWITYNDFLLCSDHKADREFLHSLYVTFIVFYRKNTTNN